MIVLIVIAVTVRVPNHRAGMIAYENNNIVDSSDRTLAV